MAWRSYIIKMKSLNDQHEVNTGNAHCNNAERLHLLVSRKVIAQENKIRHSTEHKPSTTYQQKQSYRIPVLLGKTFSLPIPLASQQNLQHGSASMDPPWQLDDLRKCRRLMLGNWFHKMALGLGTALSWFLPLPLPLLLSLPYLPLRMTERDSHNISFTS